MTAQASGFDCGPAHAPGLLTIDLDAIAENYRILCTRAAHGRCAGVVKANGYGLGLEPVIKALWSAGCRTFFTAHLDEAIAARSHLPEAEIGVLNGLITGDEDIYRGHNLLPTLNDLGQLHRWADYCRGAGQPLPASLHIDTGMARLGLPQKELEQLYADLSPLEAMDLRYIMSHMACADMPEEPMNQDQRDRFAEALKKLPKATAMLANSSATFLGKDWHFDMLRPGVALFGGAPNEDGPNPMKQVVRLQTKILQIQEIDAPQTVGYGAAFKATGPRRIATLAVGYADGFLRSLSCRGTAYYGDQALPLVGRVSMDLTAVDVTDAPTAQVGEMVDLIGPNHDINALAREAGTIPYEILTSLGQRYKRHYVGGLQP
ncbi:alanine racemase [Aestuariispira ectoiniformans]|uniref:alanine racemase n=1 Tax=Aestuariispira ectoiniformans TaxID=2775080 RepID=UPI00223BE64D|nr:alanine racemase [Aestuariispira ectoiniformans]